MVDFYFDGKYSYDYGIALCNFDSQDDSNTISDITFDTFTPVQNDKNYFVGSKTDNTLTTTLSVCKIENCEIVDMSTYDVELIARWLCREDGYHRFAFLDNSENIEYNAKFSLKKNKMGGKIITLEATITTDSQYGYTKRKLKKDLEKSEVLNVNNNSSLIGEIPVNLQIECKTDGNYSITHTYNNKNRTIEINNCKKGECINISDMCVISSSIPSHDISNDFNYVFPTLISTMSDNKNYYTVNYPCVLTIEYEQRRKVGL